MGVDGTASTAQGLTIFQQFIRAPLETLDLAYELSLSLAMSSSFLHGCHPTLKLKRCCYHPINILCNSFVGRWTIELVAQFCDGLPGELLRALGFHYSEFQLGKGFWRELRLGVVVDRTAAYCAEAKED
jgi:hypothetical protein